MRWGEIFLPLLARILHRKLSIIPIKIYLEFGADEHVEGISNSEEVKEIRKRAIQAGLKLVDCPIRHLGTEKARDLYFSIEKHFVEHGVQILFGYECYNLILDGSVCKGVTIHSAKDSKEIFAKHTVIATGRRGADWLEKYVQNIVLHISRGQLISAYVSRCETKSLKK